MSDIPDDLHYTKNHEWVRRLAADRVEIGITEHAQAALGDLVFVDLPKAGATVSAGEAFAVVESVKAASDVYSPCAGKVTDANAELSGRPELINQQPYAGGWLVRMESDAAVAGVALLTAAEYRQFLTADAAA